MGAFIYICLIILMILLALFRFFTAYVVLIEAVLMGVGAGLLTQRLFSIHPAFSLLIGIAVAGIMLALQVFPIGFYIISGIMSVLWGLLFAVFVYDGTGGDMIWTYTVWGIGAVVSFVLHAISRDNIGIS